MIRETRAIRRYLLACLGLVLVLGLLSLPSRSPIQPERATHAGLAYARQAAANPWYFLHLDRGQEWQTTLTLTNLEAQEVGVNLSAYVGDGGFLGALPSLTSLESQTAQTIEVKEVFPREVQPSRWKPLASL